MTALEAASKPKGRELLTTFQSAKTTTILSRS